MTRSSARPRFSPMPGHAERAVLIVRPGVLHVVRGFRNTPRHAERLGVLDVPAHHRFVGLVQQRARIRAHDEQRHQILEHRRAPRDERAVLSDRGHQPAKLEPVFLRDMTHRDGDEAREPRLGCQRVVEGRVAAPFGDVVANGEEMALAVEEEVQLGRVDELPGRSQNAGVISCRDCRTRRRAPSRRRQARAAARRPWPLPHRATTRRTCVGVARRQPLLCIVEARREHVEIRRDRLAATRCESVDRLAAGRAARGAPRRSARKSRALSRPNARQRRQGVALERDRACLTSRRETARRR